MTPRMSKRARAREVYGDLAERLAPNAITPTPDPSPRLARASGGGEKEASVREEPDLNARLRDLYEKSAVPVREIARIAGVTERTIYKYVIKQNWKRRYACAARDEAVAAANRGRRWRVSPEREAIEGRADVAPAKGAGGRFIRREDIGKPYPTGLKATDAAGRERALVACRRAKSLSRAAKAKAAQEARDAEFLRALAFNARCLADLRRHREIYVKGRPPSDLQLRIESLLIDSVEWSFRRLQGFLPARSAAPEPPPKVTPVAKPVANLQNEPAPRFDPDDYRAWL